MMEHLPIVLTKEGPGRYELLCACDEVVTAPNPRKVWEAYYTHAGKPIPDDLPHDNDTQARWGVTPGRREREVAG